MSDIDPDPGFNSKTACIQVAWGIWVNMSNIVIGLAYGFPMGQMPQITSPESNIAVSFVEELWIDNVLILFCPLGCLFSGHVMDEYGRRISLLISQVPMCLGWLCISSAQSVIMLIVGRAITGIACGMAMDIPTLYTSEVSLPNMRGLLGAFPLIFLYFGIIIQVGLGSIVEWQKMCFLYFAMNAFLFFSYLLLANSPQFLLMRNIHDAIHAVTYFRASGYKIDREQNRLIEFKQENNIRRLTLKEQRYVLFLRAVCKPFAIVMTYMAFACLFGLPVASVWTINVFLFTDASYVRVGYILIALTGFVSSLLTAWLLYHFNRRKIALFSGLGVAGTCVILGFILRAGSGQTIAPQLLLMLYTVFVTMGFQCLPFLLMTELYIIEVRGILISVSLTIFNLMSFAVMQSFPCLNIIFGIPGIAFILGACALLAVLVLYLYLPETRRLTLQEIEEYYRGGRPALISDREISEARAGKRTIKPEIAAMFSLGRSSDAPLHLRSKSFVEASGSMISICSRRSVVLHVGDKHYISEERKHEIDLHETQHQLDKQFFGHRDSVINTDEEDTSHKSKHTR